ncbi:MAG: XRE family transcriptional regulator [Geminicoccaceae bacterium]
MTPAKARLGQALRNIRQRHHWTLAEVSARTGLAVSTLSKVENGQLSLTYDKLVQLSEGLEVDIGVLFGAQPGEPRKPAPEVTGRRSITPKGEGLRVETPNYDYRYLCADLAMKGMVPIVITIRARSIMQFATMSSHSGEEFIYVLRGKIQVHTEYYEPVELKTGDSMYIDSTMKHAFLTTGGSSATMLNVCWSPTAGHFRTLFSLAQLAATGSAGHVDAQLGEAEPV